MYVAQLTLHNFRSYPALEIALRPGSTAFIGANGQGKTNIVEAIDYLATLSSHRVSSDAPLVAHGSGQGVIRASIVRGERTALLEVEITPGKANRARINRSPLPRARDLIGVLRTVLFSPEDLALVKGDPAERRRFLDVLLTLRSPRHAGTRADYDRVVKQRNALLKTSGRRVHKVSESAMATLAIWDEQLAHIGAQLMAARLQLLADLAPLLGAAYLEVAAASASHRQVAVATYRSSISIGAEHDEATLEKQLLEAIDQRRTDEIERGVSLVGPHRDDMTLTLGDLPAKGYASHGESWSFALALKLASFELLRADGDDPVLILDDVFAELDRGRRDRLAILVSSAEQVLITAAVAEDVPEALMAQRFTVSEGLATRD